ncbi:PREDICTED: shematrin-like protein 2 [Wasmannia auropunctata]|uniref:shematrin-like protein 2 n=1 Tax=Wasmannia auropunctata TaxID=64793 RepID=UPI0005EE89FC|nr:PREDICTED: shematrin-like protein 2 [Wasmannia auropunctata]
MKSVSDMLRPLHFVFLIAAFAVLAAAVENEAPANVPSEVEPQPNANDLEADATYWGYYGRPYYKYGGWGGYGGRGYGGWGGWGRGWGGYGLGGWGRGGWGGRGYGGGWGWGYWG